MLEPRSRRGVTVQLAGDVVLAYMDHDELLDFPEGIAAVGGVFEGVEGADLGEDGAS